MSSKLVGATKFDYFKMWEICHSGYFLFHFTYVCGCSVCVYVCSLLAYLMLWKPEEGIQSSKLELERVLNCCVGTGK